MANSAPRERIEIRVDPEIKRLAERAAAALGCATVTEFITGLIRERAPQILQHQAAIRLTNEQFDQFMALCNNPDYPLNDRLAAAAQKLDNEGY